MTLKFLLDTSIVSVPMAKVPDAEVIRRIEAHPLECAIASLVWHELAYGCARLPAGRKRLALEAYLNEVVRPSFPILPYDEQAALWHGVERARLESVGTPAPFVDGQIAAIARTNGLILVTANPKDFSRFAGLEVQDWTRRKRRS